MRYWIWPEQREYLKTLGITKVPLMLDFPEEKYKQYFSVWKKTYPLAPDHEMHVKALGHAAWQKFRTAELEPVKPQSEYARLLRWEIHAVILLLLLILIMLCVKISRADPLPPAFRHVYLLPQGGMVPIPLPVSAGAGAPLYVICSSGCSAGGSFADNAAFTVGTTPISILGGYYTTGGAPTLSNGSAARARIDSNSYLYVDCVTGCSASAGFADNSAFTAGTTPIGIIGGWYAASPTACTTANACAPSLTIDRKLFVQDFQGTSPWVVSLTSTTVTGTVAVTQSTSPWIVAGGGTAGTPGTAVLTVQGVSGGTAVPVSGTFFQSTQPVSCATAATCPVNASQVGGPWTQNLTQVAGTALGATAIVNYGSTPAAVAVPAVNAAVTNTVAVSGAVTANAGTGQFNITCTAANCPVNISQVGGSAFSLGQQLAAAALPVVLTASQLTTLTPLSTVAVTQSTSPWVSSCTAANCSINEAQINGITPLMNNGVSGTGSQRVNLASDNSALPAWGQGATGSAVPAGSSYAGANGSGNLTGIIGCDNSSPINVSTGTTTQIIAISGTAGRTYICSIDLIVSAADNVTLISGSGTNCASNVAALIGGTTAASGWNLAANGGLTKGSGLGMILKTTTTNNEVCIVTSATAQLSGSISWTQF
jgi:hypothetical protein